MQNEVQRPLFLRLRNGRRIQSLLRPRIQPFLLRTALLLALHAAELCARILSREHARIGGRCGKRRPTVPHKTAKSAESDEKTNIMGVIHFLCHDHFLPFKTSSRRLILYELHIDRKFIFISSKIYYLKKLYATDSQKVIASYIKVICYQSGSTFGFFLLQFTIQKTCARMNNSFYPSPKAGASYG